MKAQLKPVKAWMPHKDKDIEKQTKGVYAPMGSMQVFVGNLHVGWVYPVATEPEELFVFDSQKLLYYMDTNDILFTADYSVKGKNGKPLQDILDKIELLFKDFLNKICV